MSNKVKKKSSVYRLKYKIHLLDKAYQKYLFMKRKLAVFNNFIKKLIENGHETITFMLVPHFVNKKVFTLRVSKFTLLFLIILICSISAFSVIAINDSQVNDPIMIKLEKKVETNNLYFNMFKKKTETALDNAEKLINKMKKLLIKIGVKTGQLNSLMNVEGLSVVTKEQQLNYGKDFEYTDEIKELDNFNLSLIKCTEQLKRLTAFFNNIKSHIRIKGLNNRYVHEHKPSFWPVAKRRGIITSPFGDRFNPFKGAYSFHRGVDIAYLKGTYLRSTAPGRVVKIDKLKGGYGNYVLIKHKNGYSTRYAHLDTIEVFEGDLVYSGQIIGTMGDSGFATGVHIHYEVILYGVHLDPEDYMDKNF